MKKSDKYETVYLVKFEGKKQFMRKSKVDELQKDEVPVKVIRKATEKERKLL